MKKLLLMAAICCSLNAIAQKDSSMADTSKMGHKMHKMMMKDCVMMMNNKMMTMMSGNTMNMDKDMTMKDGSTVMTNGTVKKPDGTTVQLMEGDCVYMDGTIKHKKKKM